MLEAQAGDQVGLLLKGLKKDEVRRGMVVVTPGTLKQHDHVEAQLYVLNKDEGGVAVPIVDYTVTRIYSKTWDCSANVRIANLNEREMIMPGEDGKYVKFIIFLSFFYRQTYGNRT